MLKRELGFRKIPYSILLLFSIFVLVRSVGSANGDVFRTYYASDYNILNGAYLSGSVPASVQTVDSDYLIIRSVASDTPDSTYYPSGYTFGGSTTWISGGLSDLTSNDGVYMSSRSYAHYDYDYHYAESDSISSTTEITWQDKVTLTFTSVADAYLVMASAELRGSSGSYDVEAQLTIDGAAYACIVTRPDETATDLYSHHFATFEAINLTEASHTFRIQYRSSSGFGTCSIQHARIAVFRIFDYALAESEGSQAVSGGYADKVTKSFNVEVAGEYLVIASAELNPASTLYSVLARMEIDSEYQDEVSLEGEGITSSWESYFTHDVKSFDAGFHTVSIQASSESGTHFIQRARIIAVKLTDYFLGWESGKSNSYTTNDATSWADKLVVTFNPSTQCEYLILATAIVGGDSANGESYHSSFDSTLDGTEEGWWHGGISDNTDRITYAALKNSTLSQASHSLKLRYHSESSTSPDAGMGSARIIAIPMGALKAVEVCFTGSSNLYTWTQLEWAIDSAWTTGSVSVTLQLYNYSLGGYSASGSGYISYTSSATVSTDETRSQMMTVNPAHFGNASGYWKLKVKGVKSIETQFDFKADWIEFKPTYSEYAVSTEFLFSGMTTNTPTQLNFTVVSDYNITNVNVTIQVWNYSSLAYATGGEAYLKYASSGKNETKTLSVNTNPQFYVSNEIAKIKITGVFATPTQFQQEINQVKLLHSYDIHDVAVIGVTASATEVTSGQVVSFTVIAKNNGTVVEAFNVTVFCNESIIERKTVTNLPPGDQTTLEFAWNTTGLEEASYTIRAEAGAVPGEADANNNAYTATVIKVNMQSSSQPFDWLTALLFALPVIFGLLFLLVLKLKRKKKTRRHIEKRTDTFSQQFGMTHQQMIGKKMLLEIDPTSDFHKALSSFVSEAKNSDELLFILTNKTSTLHSAFSGDANVKFLLLTSKTSSLQQINENEALLPATDLSVLLDAFVRAQEVELKETINVLFDNLSDIILRCGFEKTYKFTRLLLEAISPPKTTALFVFNSAAHDPTISSSIQGLFQFHLAYTKRGLNVRTLF